QAASPASSASRPRSQVRLEDGVQYLRGVGPAKAGALLKLGIRTVAELLEYFPVRFDRRECRTVENLDEGMIATVVGQITVVRIRLGGRRRSTVQATFTDNTGRCSLSWFNAGWMKDRLQPGAVVRVTGRVTEYRQLPQFVNPRIAF